MLMTTRVLPSVRPPPSGVISHVNTTQECSWYVTMIVPRPILCFPQVRVRTYLTTCEERRKKKEGKIHVFPSFIFVKQIIAQELK